MKEIRQNYNTNIPNCKFIHFNRHPPCKLEMHTSKKSPTTMSFGLCTIIRGSMKLIFSETTQAMNNEHMQNFITFINVPVHTPLCSI